PLMLPAVAFPTDQLGTITTGFPFTSLPTAVNCCGAPTLSVSDGGLTVIVASAPATTFTVATPEMGPLVACTVFAYAPATVPAVNSPALSMVHAVTFTTDQLGGTGTMLPFTSWPTAVYCCLAPTLSVSDSGLTVIVASVPATTFTVAKPETAPLVACTVPGYVPATIPAVKSPVPPLMVPAVAFTTDQAGTMLTMFPFTSLPTA